MSWRSAWELATQVGQVEGGDRSEFGRHDELVAARHRLAELTAELQERTTGTRARQCD